MILTWVQTFKALIFLDLTILPSPALFLRWNFSRTFKRDLNNDYGIYPDSGEVVVEALDRNPEYEHAEGGKEANRGEVYDYENYQDDYDQMYDYQSVDQVQREQGNWELEARRRKEREEREQRQERVRHIESIPQPPHVTITHSRWKSILIIGEIFFLSWTSGHILRMILREKNLSYSVSLSVLQLLKI